MKNEFVISWPGWETVRLIGRGGFGAVYEIRRDVFGEWEKAALKVISLPQNAGDIEEMYNDGYDYESITQIYQTHLKSIVSEYSLMRKMNGCPNIVSCDDIRYIQHDDGIGWDIFIKMELLTPLPKALPAQMSEGEVVKIARDLCNALELCKEHNVVHRDIKPQNIFVSRYGDYKLGDFGIAKTMEKTSGGTKVGTYKYMAPEVYHNQPYGSVSDIYSLGLVLYWLLNERRMPFMPLPPETLSAGMEEESRFRRFSGEKLPAPKNGSEELKGIVLKACAYDPKDRYASASEMLIALESLKKTDTGAVIRSAEVGEQNDAENDETLGIFSQSRSGKKLQTREEKETSDTPPVTDGKLEGSQSNQISQQTDDHSHRKERKPPYVLLGVIAAVILLLIGFFTIHSWTAVTCTEDSVCKICGKIRSSASGHTWMDATCTAPQTCSVCGVTQGSPVGHRWSAATCTSAKTCAACGLTEGTPTDHNWQAATCTSAKTCAACGLTEGTPTDHNWQAATCTMPQTCSTCDKTVGSVLAHQWEAATCEKPQSCAACGATQGEALGHIWTEASFIAPKTCARCAATEGTPRPYDQIDVEAEIGNIQAVYYNIHDLYDAGELVKYSIRSGVDGYLTADGSLVYVVVYRGTEGIGSDSDVYSRSYYYSNGELVFAFFEGYDSHRLYFCDEYLMRWLYRYGDDQVYHDFTFSDDYLELEKLAKEESASVCD